MAPENKQLEAAGPALGTSIGTRIDGRVVVREEVMGREEKGAVDVVMCAHRPWQTT